MRHLRGAALLGFSLLAAACGGGGGGGDGAPVCPNTSGTTALRYDSASDPALNVKPVLDSLCVTCHDSAKVGSARQDAPADHNFNTYELISEHTSEDHIPSALSTRLMPPLDQPQPSDAQRQQLIEWTSCGAPR